MNDSSKEKESLPSDISEKIDRLLIESKLPELKKWFCAYPFSSPENTADTAWYIFERIELTSPLRATFFGDIYLDNSPKIHLGNAIRVSGAYRRAGHTRKFLEIYKRYSPNTLDYKLYRLSLDEINLLENGFPLTEVPSSVGYTPTAGKVLYLLNNSLPYNSGGYACRTHGLLSGLKKEGIDVIGVTRLCYPLDEKNPPANIEKLNVVDDITYLHLPSELPNSFQDTLTNYLNNYIKEIEKIILNEKPEIIHAASNYMNGIVANYFARKYGTKAVYEIRGLVELFRISEEPEWEDSDKCALFKKMEAETASNADKVITITQALKQEMILRGVSEDKITVIHNGVDTERFYQHPPDATLKRKLGLEDKIVIGFVGTLNDYEGLDYLIDAVAQIKNRGAKEFAVLIVGDGAAKKDLQDKVAGLKLEDLFIFTGRVPHNQVESYYSIIDIAPLPRKAIRVCEMVSPLKPFEAMAMGKPLLVSSVDALKEIVIDGKTGAIFEKGNINSLAQKLIELIENRELRNELGKNARKWVVEHRDWKTLSKKISELYRMM